LVVLVLVVRFAGVANRPPIGAARHPPRACGGRAAGCRTNLSMLPDEGDV
jgi:hypothetical protein